MAWVAITNNPNWQYNNSPEDPGAGSPLRALWLKQTNGIRTIGSGAGAHQVYSEVRRVGDTTNRSRGELSKSYWDAREGTLSSYAVNNFDPKLVFDFTGNVFKTGGVASTFSNSITHARAGQATMVDSDGLLKWSPHNLLPYSEDFSIPVWVKSNNGSVVVDNAVAPDGTTTAATLTIPQFNARTYQRVFNSHKAGDKITFSFWVRSDTVTSIIFGVGGGTNVANNNASANTVAPVTSTWNLVELEFTVLGNDTSLYFIIGWYDSLHSAQIGDVEIWHPHAYRSDLGGMVNNSAQSTGFETYVPTTSSTVYAPRVGHHVYNGSAWVNEGILHESEARTNLMVYSGDLTNSDWTSPRLTVGAVTAGSPFGAYQSITPVANGTVKANAYQVGKSITSGATYVGWALVKYSAGSGWFAINMYDTGKGDERAYFDLQNGVVGAKDALIIDHGMVDYGDGWWLCWASANAASGTGGLVVTVTNGNSVVTGSISDTILIAGSQFELGSTPSSYIPTTSSTVTRAAETLTVPVANLPYPTPVEVTGTELVTNGTFDSNTNDWASFNSTLSVDSNRLKVTDTGYFGTASTHFPTVSGKSYLITADFIHGGTLDGMVTVQDGQFEYGTVLHSGGGDISSVSKTYSIIVKAVSHTTKLTLKNSWASSGGFGNLGDFNLWDNVSIKEINPLALSIQMDGKITYADDGSSDRFIQWGNQGDDEIRLNLEYGGAQTGSPNFIQRAGGVIDILSDVNAYSPNVNVPFNLASRHGSTFINGAVDGTALTADITPTELPDLSSSTLSLGFDFMGTIGQFRVWDEDLTDAGIVEATEPSTEPSLQLTFDGLSTNSFTVLDWSE